MNRTTRLAVVLALPLLLLATEAWAGVGASSNMPYSPWFTQFRQSITGEVPLLLSCVLIAVGLAGWVGGGDLTGVLFYVIRAVMAISFMMGAVILITNIATGGADVGQAALAITGGGI